MLTVLKNDAGGRLTFSFVGTIDGESDFEKEVGDPGATPRFDLALISHINSVGVKRWMRYLENLKKLGKAVTLVRCSPAIVEQVNLVPAFVAEASLESICLPYICESCHKDLSLVVPISDLLGGKAPANEVTCVSCKGTAVFDDLLEDYLQFLKKI